MFWLFWMIMMIQTQKSSIDLHAQVKRVRMKAFVTDFDPKEQQNQIQETWRPYRAWISAQVYVQKP